MLVKMAAPRKCLSYALNRLLISNIYLSYATPGGRYKLHPLSRDFRLPTGTDVDSPKAA